MDSGATWRKHSVVAAMVVAVRQVLDYSDTFKAVIVVLIGFVVYGFYSRHRSRLN